MAFIPSDSAVSGVPNADAALRDEILQELIEVASAAANAQLDGLTTKLADAMQRSALQCADPAQAQRIGSAAALLKKNRYPFCYVVSERLRASLAHEMRLAVQPSASLLDNSGALKSLPPDIEVDKKLCLVQVSRVLESDHGERLALLGRRLRTLLECDELPLANHPFRPQVFLTVLHDAWCEFHPDTEAHALLYPLLQPTRCIDMAPVLHALGAALVRRGVAARDGGAASAVSEQAAMATELPANDLLSRKLRQLFPAPAAAAANDGDRLRDGAFPTLIGDDALQATAARQKLVDYLVRVEQSQTALEPSSEPLLEAVRRQAPAGALTPADEHAFDLLIAIFDAVLHDPDIPAEMGALLGSLQLPLLKTALADKDFFFKPQHPARQTLELLAKAGIGWNLSRGKADPLYRAIRRDVDRVLQQTAPQPAVFADVASVLESLAGTEQRAVEEALAMPIAEARQREKRQQAAKAAHDEVALRVGTGEVVALVETFLEEKWAAVLTLAYGVKDEKPQLVANAVQTMDELVWSVKPKSTMAERKELLAKLPSMLATLNKWLDVIKWNDAERERFFTELAACHASIVRAPLDVSPERQAALAIEAAKKATERRLRKRAAQPPQPEPDEFDGLVQTLESGVWMECVQEDESSRKLRLAWVSPMRSLYVFATRERQEALTLSAEELAQALREQRARIVAVRTGLVGRVIATTLGVESANVANVDSPVAA